MKLDVVILSRRDPLYLDKVLNSIKKEISFHRLIFVANSPTDRALNLVKKFGGVVYIENYGSLGKAREYAITLVDCPYFILVDDDCVLRTNFMELTKYLEVNVGAIEGLDYIMNPRRQLYAEAMDGNSYLKLSEVQILQVFTRGVAGLFFLSGNLLRPLKGRG